MRGYSDMTFIVA